MKADPVAAAAQPAGNSSCIVAVYGVQVSTTKYIFPHAFYNLTCYAPSIFLCKATVDHDRSSVVTATTTGGRVEVRSRPGELLMCLTGSLIISPLNRCAPTAARTRSLATLDFRPRRPVPYPLPMPQASTYSRCHHRWAMGPTGPPPAPSPWAGPHHIRGPLM